MGGQIEQNREQAFRPPRDGGQLGPSLTGAADLASIYYAGPLRSVAFNWVGPYVGATLGYQWSNFESDPTTPPGVAGGLRPGFNWRNGSLGGQTEIGFSAGDDMFAPWQFSNPWFGTADGRAGIAVNGATPFGRAGIAVNGATPFGPAGFAYGD